MTKLKLLGNIKTSTKFDRLYFLGLGTGQFFRYDIRIDTN